MRQSLFLILVGGLSMCMGMTGDGCASDSTVAIGFRLPPAIIPTNPSGATRQRTLEVDLRGFPETEFINWDFGDGGGLNNLSSSAGSRVIHEFAGDGTFVVSVHLFSGRDVINGNPPRLLAIGSLPIDVIGPNVAPIAAFTSQEVFDDQGVLNALAKRFIASSSRDSDGVIVDYQWDFGDGAQGSGQIVEHTYARSGRFSIRLIVTDDRGDSVSIVRTVLINSPPTASFSFSEDAGNPLRITFDATGSSDSDGQIQQLAWDFGDGTATENGNVVSHTYAVPDDYTVTLTVTDELGAAVSTSQVISVSGIDPFVRSISPAFGEVDTVVSAAVIDGENFQDGATVRLEMGSNVVSGTLTSFQDASTILSTFDLNGAALGDYDIVVENPDTTFAKLTAGFRVVTANTVRLTTSFGDIVMELVDDAPITTANFLQYVEDQFFDGTIFHRIAPGFVVQGGGFLPGMIQQTGIRPAIVNEFSAARSNIRGSVAMAKVGNDPDSATSQFFVSLADNSANLDNQNGGFTVFAHVVVGMDVVDQISAVPLGSDGSTPVDDVLLIRAERE